jgi:hypothetical protein
MSWKLRVLWVVLCGVFAIGLAACGQNAARQDASPQKPAKEVMPAKENGSPAASKAPAGSASTLTDEDRKLIEKQKICPVSGEALGGMGDPVKVVVKGRTVFLCCDGCKEALLADPDKYLAKLDQKK